METTLYPKIYESKNGTHYPLDTILYNIKTGHWKSQIEYYREYVTQHGKDNAKTLKANLPYFTVSGTFDHRSEDGLINHSGFIAIDIDSLSESKLSVIKSQLNQDPYSYAVFTSCSGNGLCVVVKINPELHHECFASLEKYYLKEYGIGIDYLADVSRPRFISFDPFLYSNKQSKLYEPGDDPGPEEEYETVTFVANKDEEKLFNQALKIVEKSQSYEAGNRHNFVYDLARVCNKFGISQHNCETFVNITFPHFSKNPSNAIAWVYRKKVNQHGAFEKQLQTTQIKVKRDSQPEPLQDKEEIDNILDRLKGDWSKPVEKPDPIISIQEHTISTAGNLTIFSGPSKSGKSGVLGAIVAGCLPQRYQKVDTLGLTVKPSDGKSIVTIDTEQSKYDFDKNYRRAVYRAGYTQAPDFLAPYHLTGQDIDKLLPLTWRILEREAERTGGVHMIIIDGAADYVLSPNDEEKSVFIISEFRKMAQMYDCPLITIVHGIEFGPNQGKQRGHLGSICRRKGESLMRIERDKETGISKIKEDLARNAGLVPEIHFEYNTVKGYHTFIGYEDKVTQKQNQRTKLQKIADSCLSITNLNTEELLSEIVRIEKLPTSRAGALIKQMLREGVIIENGFGEYSKAEETAPF